MAVRADRARGLALALLAASKASPDLRTARKVFATLNAQSHDLNLMFTPGLPVSTASRHAAPPVLCPAAEGVRAPPGATWT